jgi:hypothetical protein
MAPGTAALRSPFPGAELLREFEAVLRWRARGLERHVDARATAAARLFPVLLHASFQKPPLNDEPPGVSGMRFRTSWGRWAAVFGLPPPARLQRGACLAEAVFAYPGPAGLELVVLVSPGLGAHERRRLQTRIDLAAAALGARGVLLAGSLVDAAVFCTTPFAARTFMFGALIAGQPTPETWSALYQAWGTTLAKDDVPWLFDGAPTSLSSLAIGLLAARMVPPALAAMEWALGRGVGARALASPDATPLAWASLGSGLAAELEATLRLVHPPVARPGPRLGGVPTLVASRPDVPELLRIGGILSLAFLRAVRNSPALRASPRWREVIASGIPRSLLNSLGDGIRASGPAPAPDPGLVPVAGSPGFEVGFGHSLLAQGATSLQARVRALALATAAGGESQLGGLDSHWRTLAARLGRKRSGPALILVVGEASGNEPPLDPINRGPLRQIGFPSALVVRLAPGRRPTAHVLASEKAIESFLRAAGAGVEVEVLPSSPGAKSVALRLAEVAKLFRAGREGTGPASEGELATPIAVQAGGKVYLASSRALRRYPLGRFLCRPRTFLADPDAPDLALSPGDRSGPGRHSAGFIQVRLSLAGPRHAWVLYSNGLGRFRDLVPLQELEEHLRDARSVLQETQPGAALALRSDAELESALRRTAQVASAHRLDILVRGELPTRLQILIGRPGQVPDPATWPWFGGPQSAGWESAALAAMACWVPGEEGHVACRSARVTVPYGCSPELTTLYVRSVAIRRLNAHLRRLLGPYRNGE